MRKGAKGERMRWHAIVDRVPHDRPIVGVELGVFEGVLSYQLLKRLPSLTLYMVDRWSAYQPEEIERTPNSKMPQRPQGYFDAARESAKAVALQFEPRVVIVKMDTISASRAIATPLDFVFVDADHSYEGCTADIKAWMHHIKPGGWMLGHDYGSDKRHPDVRRAVDEIFGDRVEVDSDHVWAVQL